MKNLIKILIKKFGFLFEDFPLESGLGLIIISGFAIYFLRNRVFYLKGDSILKYIVNLKTLSYAIGFIGISQVLKGLKIYNSILSDLQNGLEFFSNEYPIALGCIIIGFGIYLIYDKFKPLDEKPFNTDYIIIRDEDKYYDYKLWFFIAIIILIGSSMIYRNI